MSPADLQNFPLLDESGAALLRFLREHAHAPRYTHAGCDRLTAAGLERVRAFEATLHVPLPGWRQGEVPEWLRDFAAMCFHAVPFYRRYGALPTGTRHPAAPTAVQRAEGLLPADFFDIPTCGRDDVQREPWAFVPDPLPLDDLVIYQTSGTTGHPLDILTHPEPLAMYVPLLQAALATRGVRLTGGPGSVAIVCVCFQRRTWTYAAISPVLRQAGYAKVNLNPADWHDPSDRAAFLDACDAQVYTGDPLSFAELARLPLRTRPQALISTAMMLLPALRQSLEQHFGCPVVDLYSTNETGPIAVAGGEGFLLLQPRLYVEILDPDGRTCSGTRGEVTVSGGFNPFLPLLRYRTGDYARLVFRGSLPVLIDLEGRPPVVFRGAAGQALNNIDVSNALKPFALAQFALHQFADGSLRLRVRGGDMDRAQLRETLLGLFGAGQVLAIEESDVMGASGGKVVQYTRDG